ncbi:protein PIGBOS1 [Engystomops pustulosus]|uniref:protein PIGBOS1 n=1 Tax=Engystomops pustulosus TaxID=76066 RepID=UPI003AFAE3CA
MMRRLPFGQVFLAVLLGFASGVYIYKPLIQEYMFERRALESDIASTETGKKENE